MEQSKNASGVMLPEGHTGSSFFHKILDDTAREFPEDFKGLTIPQGKVFKKTYGNVVVEFESMRINSPRRSEIAKHIVRSTQDQLFFRGENFAGSFVEYLKEDSEPSPITVHKLNGEPGLDAKIPFRGRYFNNKKLGDLGHLLSQEEKITNPVKKALLWMESYCGQNGGKIDLTGKKFVVLGASAELAPTDLLLKAGATVLWIDIQNPDKILDQRNTLAGELHVPDEANNVLLQPRKIKATIEAFAGDDAVHIGMFAYAGGASQEWRLAATMNAIIRNINPDKVDSISMLISPTAAAAMQPEDCEASQQHYQHPPLWQIALKKAGLLGEKAFLGGTQIAVAKAIVPIQGVSYQAAQYVSKVLAAEVFATYGVDLDKPARPVTVSANVAGITRTRSLQHPIFQAGFIGAGTFGVEIFDAQTTQGLANFLILHDILNPESYDRSQIASLFSRQVHGGIYSRGFALEPMIRIAAVIGLARKPKLILKLF